ncbi:uncharacterized protein C18orf19 homolog A-like [Euwallacea fornicatus]|uniref:uncharacterized protein C18orf19 homolog A-like n=1 Tax=Euwallacea fornicatus TaxID=995702 RepID=UPI00338E3F67
MSLVLPRTLIISCLRQRVIAKGSLHRYHCFALSKSNLTYHNHLATCSNTKFLSCKVNSCSSYNVTRYNSTTNRNTEEQGANKDEKKLSLFQRFKQMYRDYWYVLVPVHLVTSAAWFGSFYYLASSGVDVPALLETIHVSDTIVNTMRNSSMGYVAIAYGLYKITTPVRYTVTLGGTTISITYLTKWGYIKPMPSKERLKEIYAETKEGMKETRENLMETVHNIQQTVKDTKEGIKEKKDSLVSTVKESKESIKNIKEKVISSTTNKQNKS